MMKQLLLLILSVCSIFLFAKAQNDKVGQECFPSKNNERLLYDVANLLSSTEQIALENKLDQFAASTSNQIAVVIVSDLCGMDKAQFTIELGEAWGLGQGKSDNGLLMLIKPKTGTEKGKYFIAVGRGLEGAIPDAKLYLIEENEMVPRFRQNDMYGGINAGLDVLMSLAKGEYNIDSYADKKVSSDGAGMGFILLFVLLFIGVFLLDKASQVRRYANMNNIPFWTAWTLLSVASSKYKGYYGNFSGGSGNFGGFGGFGGGGSSSGGGGFGGFGGGSFGGGGAGGEW